MAKPERTRVYQNHTIDSTRWDRFEHRAGDILSLIHISEPTRR